MTIEQDLLLVLTASIDTKAMAGVTRADPELRQQDYLQTLAYYLANHRPIRRILLIENSGWPLQRFRDLAAQQADKEVELVSLNCNDYPRELGKGYGELLLLDLGLNESRLARQCSHFAKLTGRLRLLNLTRILGAPRVDYDLLCDLRDHRVYQRLGLRGTAQRCDSRFIVFRRSYYDEHVRGHGYLCNDSKGIYLENVLYDLVKRTQDQAIIVPRFVTEPRFQGTPAHGGSSYGSPRQRLKWAARWALRKAMPGFYF